MINNWTNIINTKNQNEITILFLGQSNAGDRVNVPDNGMNKIYNNVNYISYSNNSEQYSGTLEFSIYDRTSGNCGIELSMLYNLPENRRINLIKYFYGSKGLKQQPGDADFNPNSTNELYDRGIFKGDGTGFCEQIVNYHGLRVDFVIWVQGEQDAVINSETYESDLELLTNSLRTDFNNQNLIFIYNRLHSDYYYYSDIEHAEPGKTYVRSGQASFNNNNKNKMIDIDEIEIGDIYNVHFDQSACIEIGELFANYILTKI